MPLLVFTGWRQQQCTWKSVFRAVDIKEQRFWANRQQLLVRASHWDEHRWQSSYRHQFSRSDAACKLWHHWTRPNNTVEYRPHITLLSRLNNVRLCISNGSANYANVVFLVEWLPHCRHNHVSIIDVKHVDRKNRTLKNAFFMKIIKKTLKNVE